MAKLEDIKPGIENIGEQTKEVAETTDEIRQDGHEASEIYGEIDVSAMDQVVAAAYETAGQEMKAATAERVENEVENPTREITETGGELNDEAEEGKARAEEVGQQFHSIESVSDTYSDSAAGAAETAEQNAEDFANAINEINQLVDSAEQTAADTKSDTDGLF